MSTRGLTHAQANALKPVRVHDELEQAVALRLLRDEMQGLGFSAADIHDALEAERARLARAA